MGDGGEGGDKNRGSSVGAGYAVQGSSAVGVDVWEQEWGGDKGHAKSTRDIPSSLSKKDYRNDCAAYNDQGVGAAPGG